MPSVALKLFYKGNKLSVLHTNDAHHTVVSASGQNLCEATSDATQKRFLASDAQYSTVFTHEEYLTTIAYTPYGEDTCPPDSPPIARFTGQSWLPSVVGYLLGNGHRLFSTEIMRFHSPDSFSPFASGGLNAYAYCGNDPINRIDPSGRSFRSLFKRLTGGYSYRKLAPRLKDAAPNLSRNEYNALSKSIEKRQLRSEKKLDLGFKTEGVHTTANAFAELKVLKRERKTLNTLTVDNNRRYNFDTTPLTQELHGDIPVHAGPTGKLAEKILSSPSTIDPSIPEELVDHDLQERLRRLREG
ncbi:RHS repeat-associated core domain-containing protein [Pseudomonas sp. NPDC008258]|uniref:RHS repeat-associated core domain-containing protein n=1 Tax=Pseudomonas sp. NPDC008258 TaxID=3364418 RepID=UPI0036E91AEB